MESRGRIGVAIMGATATGKTKIAIDLCERFQGEIISMDSRQVYRDLDIGTAKPTAGQRAAVPHHLVDMIDPHTVYSAGKHRAAVEEMSAQVWNRGRIPFLVGGTGLYFRVLFEGLAEFGLSDERRRVVRAELDPLPTPVLYEELQVCDPRRAAALSPKDRVRIMRALEVFRGTGRPFSEHVDEQSPAPRWRGPRIVLTMPRLLLRARIEARTRELFAAGWVAEVLTLIGRGVRSSDPAMQSLGYATIAEGLKQGASEDEMRVEVTRRTQQYAKRQETFLRSIPGTTWVDVGRAGAVSEIEATMRADPDIEYHLT